MSAPCNPQPPRLADWLLLFICTPHRLEEVQGDLHEEFIHQVDRIGERRARWRYWWDVIGFIKLRLVQPSIPNSKPDHHTRQSFLPWAMLQTYFSVAFRQLWKNPLFSLLTTVGLIVGLAVSTFITLYVWHEFHYDRFQPFADRTYRMMSVSRYGGEEVTFPAMHESVGVTVKRQIPEIEQVVRFSNGFGDVVLQSNPRHQFKEINIGFADASMLSVMGLQLRQGNPATALNEPGRIVLTRPLAEKYFGTQNPVGKTILFDKHYPLTVSGVLDDLPTHSVIQFNGLVSLRSMPNLGAREQGVYKSAGFLSTFLVLRPGADVKAVEQKMKRVQAGIQFTSVSSRYFLEALPSLHLDSRSSTSAGTRQSLYILLTIALVILVLAIINYVSLTTARATKRAKEVGIRKAIGGQRRELIGQFLLESFLTTTVAFALSLAVLYGLFPWASQTLDLHMDIRVLSQGVYWGLMVLLWLTCSLLAGAYPALLLSGFRPALVLKGVTTVRYGGAGLRQIFTMVQFTASIGLLICSLVLYTQIRYLRTKSLGINRAQVVALYIDREMVPQFAALRDDLRRWAGPDNVAVTNTKLFSNNIMTYFMETVTSKKQLMVNALSVDKTFFRMMGIRWQYPPAGWETGSVTKELTVYNQSVMKEARIQGNPLQQPAPFKGQLTQGVVSDFHVSSLHGPVSPMMLSVVSDTSRSFLANGGYLLIRLKSQTNVPDALDQLRTIYDRHHPPAPFDYYFLDEAYNQLYAKEERLARLFNGFTALTLLVACLGLLGLMTFSVEARTKEIGVRKVLGASIVSIVTLLSTEFIKLIAIAVVVSSPVAWWAMNKWLQGFAYKVDISWWVFALAGGLALTIALLTISFQSVKAALANPVKALRSE